MSIIMYRKMVFLIACLLTAAAPGLAAANVPNGDLEDPVELRYWRAMELALPGYAAVDEVADPPAGDRLHLMARNTCTWTASEGWSLDQLSSSAMAANPYVPTDPNYEMLPPVGTAYLRFDAKIDVRTIESGVSSASYLDVGVYYNGGLRMANRTLYGESGWGVHMIELVEIDVSSPVSLLITASSGVDFDNFPGGQYDGYIFEVIAEGWFDNFRFIPVPISGDADLDGTVDDDDLSLLLSNWGLDAGWYGGNFNEDGTVDDDDLSLLLSNWQVGTQSGEGSVPEPGALSLLVTCAALLVRRRDGISVGIEEPAHGPDCSSQRDQGPLPRLPGR